MSPAQNTTFYNKVAQFKIAEDSEDTRPDQVKPHKGQLRVAKEKTDSGYHGTTEDEMDVDSQQSAAMRIAGADPFYAPAALAPALETLNENMKSAEKPTNSDSFVSANEDLENPENYEHDNNDNDDNATVVDDEMHVDVENAPQPESSPLQQVPLEEIDEESGNWQVENEPEPVDAEDDLDVKSPSDAYSPEKPLLRKSSLNFAALPAREPLTAKRSIGPGSGHVDAFAASRNSVLGRQTHGKSLGVSQEPVNQDEEHDEADANGESQESQQLQSKSSTQTLHERIAALGQTKELRMSKSIPTSLANLGYPVLLKDDSAPHEKHHDDDDDDDWIAPIEKGSRPASGVDEILIKTAAEPGETALPAPVIRHSPSKYLLGHQKSSSTVSLISPNKLTMAPESLAQKAYSVSNPNLSHAMGTSTPMSSPGSKKFADGPLSASKARLYSVLKSAKGIFASSAGASAQAKMDVLSSPVRAQQGDPTATSSMTSRMPGGFDDIPMAPKPAARPAEGRKTRSSTENEKKDQAMDALDKVRQKEREKAAEQKQERDKLERANSVRQEQERFAAASRADSEVSAPEDQSEGEEIALPPPPKSTVPAGKLRAPGRLARPTKPASSQAKPAPQLIRVASQSQRFGSVQPPGPSDSTPSTTTRSATTRAGSAQPGSKSAPASAARVRALEAAARKKEQVRMLNLYLNDMRANTYIGREGSTAQS